MRSKTHQQIKKEEYDFLKYRLSYDDQERLKNDFLYGYSLTDKELRKYLMKNFYSLLIMMMTHMIILKVIFHQMN